MKYLNKFRIECYNERKRTVLTLNAIRVVRRHPKNIGATMIMKHVKNVLNNKIDSNTINIFFIKNGPNANISL